MKRSVKRSIVAFALSGGVARSIDPHINIWSVARPTVENYIVQNIGPKAFVRDLMRTVQVLGRFGPKLPEMAEAMLTRQAARDEGGEPPRSWLPTSLMLVAAGLVGVALGTLL